MSSPIVSVRSLRALAAVAMLILPALGANAQNSPAQTTGAAAPPTSTQTQTTPQLSPGVADVLKLSQAGVSDATVVTYIQSSDRGYGALSAPEIVYLHDAGVSSEVVNAMLNKRKQLAEANAQIAAQAAQAQLAALFTTPVSTPDPVNVTASQPAPRPKVTVYPVPYTPMFSRSAYYSGSSYRYFGACNSSGSVTYIGGSYARSGFRNGGCYSSGRSSFGRCR